ncbi:MAG: hypothetical protein sL5_06510 [Candidatus Mesenet longicola]|uniref:Uncharacterized protein n=1 Tax=Candidatus Mesenet longicola TaxID=1892558 RepID=A0A8J3MP48_9RICK|nr:MAG: hypothetical protein sGL2_06560 [Candidatus Mesenet longicola]GHM59658.1 MAG: hypothetical protein sL5_06510 [Candidatus Mesenet longicola]
MVKHKFNDREPFGLAQDIMQKKIVEQKPFELPESFRFEPIESSKPTPPPKPQRLKLEHYDEKICGSNHQESNVNITFEQECRGVSVKNRRKNFEQLNEQHDVSVATLVKQMNENSLNSNAESKCKMINIEEVQQVCSRKR